MSDARRHGSDVLMREAEAIQLMAKNLDDSFDKLVDLIEASSGRVVLSGVGKSGLVAQKIAATLTSTGTPAIYLHPTDAVHGDLGIVTADDLVILLSKSGGSAELLQLLPHVKRLGAGVAVMVSGPESSLAREADVVLSIGNVTEACDLDLVPTTSTTAMMALGDALAVALMKRRGLTAEDFAFVHPGGLIGRRMTKRVRDLMHSGNSLPVVSPHTSLRDALVEIVEKGLGVTTVVEKDHLVGVITDGDLKRILLSKESSNPLEVAVADYIEHTPATVDADDLVATAVRLMETNQPRPITSLVVMDRDIPVGVIHLHDCLQHG